MRQTYAKLFMRLAASTALATIFGMFGVSKPVYAYPNEIQGQSIGDENFANLKEAYFGNFKYIPGKWYRVRNVQDMDLGPLADDEIPATVVDAAEEKLGPGSHLIKLEDKPGVFRTNLKVWNKNHPFTKIAAIGLVQKPKETGNPFVDFFDGGYAFMGSKPEKEDFRIAEAIDEASKIQLAGLEPERHQVAAKITVKPEAVSVSPVQMAVANNNRPHVVTKSAPAKRVLVAEKPAVVKPVVDINTMMPSVPADELVQIAEFGQDNPAVKRDNLNKMQMAFAEIADAQAAEAAVAQQKIAAAKAEQEKAEAFEKKFSLKGIITNLFNVPNFAKKSAEQTQTALAPEPEKPQPLPTDIPGNKVATVVAMAAAASSAAVPPRGNGNLSMKFKEVAEVTRTVAGKIEHFHRITTYDDQVFDISQTKLTADRNLAYRVNAVNGKETYQFVDLNETVLAKLQQTMARKAKAASEGLPKVA